MPALAVNGVNSSEAASVYLPRPASGIIAALFCGYLAVGLPLPVIPLFIHDKLGFSNLIVGLVVGIQFLATVLTRGYAGRLTDDHGGKRSAVQGAVVCALGGLVYLISAMPGLSPAMSLAIMVLGRLAAGFGESQLVTGCVSWSIASVGPQRAGMSMSWTGIAMFAALAIGAPIGMALYQGYGPQAVMIACTVAPLIAAVIAFRQVSYTTPAGQRLPFYRVIGQIWREGLGLMLSGVGLSGLTAFASLYFAARDLGTCRSGHDGLRHRLHLRSRGPRVSAGQDERLPRRALVAGGRGDRPGHALVRAV
jgi:MFS family permease